MAEARKLGEFFGMVGAQSRVGSKASIDGKPNPFAKFKRGPIGDPNQT
jgi:hypothetical protein